MILTQNLFLCLYTYSGILLCFTSQFSDVQDQMIQTRLEVYILPAVESATELLRAHKWQLSPHDLGQKLGELTAKTEGL